MTYNFCNCKITSDNNTEYTMTQNYKEELSQHVENIFKQYITPGVHICDLATGGGKSYTIGKLTCEYYPEHFDRIIILCVQNKLVSAMNQEIEKFISSPQSKIKPNDKLVVENNSEVIKKAINDSSFSSLLEDINKQIDELKGDAGSLSILKYSYNWIKKTYDGLIGLIKIADSNNNEYINQQIDEGEANLRKAVRIFFDNYTNYVEKSKKIKHVSKNQILRKFPNLRKVYPQVDYKDKKVLLMTVHKAMYGIDPILSDKIKLPDFSDKSKMGSGQKGKTLILFDESDQAAIAIRNVIIEQSIENDGGPKRFAKGYNGFLQYKSLLESPEHTSDSYYGKALEECVNRAKSDIIRNWKRKFNDTIPYKSIFIDNIKEIEEFRRGVFFSGPVRLNVAQSNDKTNSYICYKTGNRHLNLIHSNNKDDLKSNYSYVITLDDFLSLVTQNIKLVKSRFSSVISDTFGKNKEKFKEEINKTANNNIDSINYLGYPTLEREIHTFFSRFESASEYQFEQQQTEFMTNPKNLIKTKGDNPIKLPDYSIYTQGVQLFQEEIDEKDNQHRIRLSSREISNTPEKIILILTHFNNTSVVLCSATASCRSVVSNFDIAYLKQTMGERFQFLSDRQKNLFDELVANTYPSNHKIKVIPIEHYEFSDKRENHLELPQKYKEMFSKEAQKEGLDNKWLHITLRELRKYDTKSDSIHFQLYRLFQFIESYYWFINQKDVHSMIFFQNRTGDKDRIQFQTLSCLIDGTYKEMPSILDNELPSDWNNNHIKISKDWDEVENEILSKLSKDKNAKIMLISAYGSFKAGTNMQYEIPDELDYISGDNWKEEGKKLKKDWDAVYLQSPTAYLMMNEDGNELSFEKGLYNAMLVLMMLYERDCLSKLDVAKWLYQALTNSFYFSEKQDRGIYKDKSAWAQTIIEQAVGRLCRTRNKPHITYLLYDETMINLLNSDSINLNKSLTKEFKALAESIKEHSNNNEEVPYEEVLLCNKANHAQDLLNNMRTLALHYTPHKGFEDEDADDEDTENGIPYRIQVAQIMNQSYKQMIIKKPVIKSLDDLTDEDKYLTFASKCYGEWNNRDDDGGYNFSYDKQRKKICPTPKNYNANIQTYNVSPSDVRLDILMKNDIIRQHFERNGYATDWKLDGLILHPQILRTDYSGEIGEEAFKALVFRYTNCSETELKHLEGKDYELADFVICNSDGSYRIAFDVKNMNPKVDHNDRNGDIPTTEKRKIKKDRLKCELITVNILQIKEPLMDETTEIGGLIYENGEIIPQGIETLQMLINA